MANESKPEVAVVMGSSSDWETMKRACDILDQFGVVYPLSPPGGSFFQALRQRFLKVFL